MNPTEANEYYKNKCNAQYCPHYLAARSYIFGEVHKKAVPTEEIDTDHLYELHLRIFGELQEKKAKLLRTENDSHKNEIQQLKKQIEKLKLDAINMKPTPSAAPLNKKEQQPAIKFEVDYENHVNYYCDAVIYVGNMAYKCCDLARKGLNVCPVHITHSDKLEAPIISATQVSSDAVVESVSEPAADEQISVPKVKKNGKKKETKSL